MTFENIRQETIQVLKHKGIEKPTSIQQQTIPLIFQGKDVIGISNTGSGKTLAFVLPLLEMIKPHQGLQVMVLAPTRELAVQIAGEFTKYGKHIRVVTVYGGVGYDLQIQGMRNSEIIVATPGRTLDHMERGNLDLSKIKCVVIDEADKMVDMGFIEDISKILSQTPRQKQVLLFGATIGREVQHLKNKYMHNPITARAELRVKEDLLKQYYYNVQHNEKFSLLVHILRKKDVGRVIIFCSARTTVELITRNLRKQGIKAEMIHGKLTQSKRLAVIKQFHKEKASILVASAVAARGLHINDVTHVINYDLSQDPEEYVHRIGRTARAGESGIAITLLSEKDYDVFNQILSNFDVKVEALPRENFNRVSFDIGRKPRSEGRYGNRSHNRGPRRNYRR